MDGRATTNREWTVAPPPPSPTHHMTLREDRILHKQNRRRRQSEIKVDIQARKLLLKVFLRFWGRGERYLRMETGVLHRISIQIL